MPVATIRPEAAISSMALVEPRAHQADAERHEGRAQQREGRDHADLDGPEPDRGQIHRQQHGDEAVAEVAQRARAIEVGGIAGRAVSRLRLRALSGSGDGGLSCDRPRWLRPEVGGAWTRSLGWRLTGSSRTTPCAPYATRAAARQDSTPAPATFCFGAAPALAMTAALHAGASLSRLSVRHFLTRPPPGMTPAQYFCSRACTSSRASFKSCARRAGRG